MSLILHSTEVTRLARDTACHHHGDQKYGSDPYGRHLEDVAYKARESLFEVDTPLREHWEAIVTAAYLHDVLEDTDYPLTTLVQTFGPLVGAVVWTVTGADTPEERKAPRRVRNEWIYNKVAAIIYRKMDKLPPFMEGLDLRLVLHGAQLVKLCDRVANVENCWQTKDRRLFMYFREHPEFRVNMLVSRHEDPAIVSMRGRLDDLLGRRP